MTVILTVTLVLAYVILSVILYNRNMNLLQTEVKQEAAYIREAINLSDSDYMKQMDNVVESTRVTQIKADGTVLYDSRRDADILKNHGNRKEVREALSKGEGADVRKSETVGKDMYYYALLLNDGTVLRVSKSIDNLASTAVSLMPVMGILAVLTILFAFALARWQTNRLIKPINELDLERPLDSDIYEELSPLLETEGYSASNNQAIAWEIEKINRQFLNEGKNYVLVGPGRWGSSDTWLGIPVKWPHISAARVIVEAGLTNYRVDPSQGTHFFQNLTSFGVGYFTINAFMNDGVYDQDFLNAQPAVDETKFLRHVRFEKPMIVKMDGKKKLGVVLRPED